MVPTQFVIVRTAHPVEYCNAAPTEFPDHYDRHESPRAVIAVLFTEARLFLREHIPVNETIAVGDWISIYADHGSQQPAISSPPWCEGSVQSLLLGMGRYGSASRFLPGCALYAQHFIQELGYVRLGLIEADLNGSQS